MTVHLGGFGENVCARVHVGVHQVCLVRGCGSLRTGLVRADGHSPVCHLPYQCPVGPKPEGNGSGPGDGGRDTLMFTSGLFSSYGCPSGLVRWPCDKSYVVGWDLAHRRYLIAKAGTWPHGSHQGKKIAVVYLFSFCPLATHPPPDTGPAVLPRTVSPERTQGLPASQMGAPVRACACSRACTSAGGRSGGRTVRGGMSPLSGQPSGLHRIPSCCHAEMEYHFLLSQILGPPKWFLLLVTHSVCPWWWSLMYCVLDST